MENVAQSSSLRVCDLDSEAMRDLWWPNDDSWMPYFISGMVWMYSGHRNPPCPGADTYADVMRNQGFLYALELRAASPVSEPESKEGL